MRVALIGYGKMGREIEKVLLDSSHQVSLIIDLPNQADMAKLEKTTTDVAIEFSNPEAAAGNVEACIGKGIPVVCGTTGWLDRMEQMRSLCLQKGGTFFYASNYSIGMNILFKLNRELAAIMNNFPEYDVRIEEVHHTTKLDKPSGTAISLAKDVIGSLDRKTSWELDKASNPAVLRIDAIRQENVPGVHTVTYESDIDIVQIHHAAKSRRGLAFGAVMAAEFINGKKGVFGMNDLLKF